MAGGGLGAVQNTCTFAHKDTVVGIARLHEFNKNYIFLTTFELLPTTGSAQFLHISHELRIQRIMF
jgi:hypothetical protein